MSYTMLLWLNLPSGSDVHVQLLFWRDVQFCDEQKQQKETDIQNKDILTQNTTSPNDFSKQIKRQLQITGVGCDGDDFSETVRKLTFNGKLW